MQMQPILTYRMDLHKVVLSSLYHNKQNGSYMLVIKKLDQVTKSALAPETLALSEAATSVLIAALQPDTFRLSRLPEVLCKAENASLVETLNTLNLVSDQCLRIDMARVKEMMAKKEIQTEWIKGRELVSSCLIKVGASSEGLKDLLHE